MKAYILRRLKLGRTSCKAIKNFSKNEIFVVRNDRDPIPNDPDIPCIRWGCTSNVPQKNVINDSKSIHLVNNKTEFRKILDKAELCPKTWTKVEDIKEFPVIVRPYKHAQGKQLYFCKDINELNVAINKCGHNWYASRFIDKVAEYRIFCMQGRVLCVAEKTPGDKNKIAWNVAQGGHFENVHWDKWPLKAVRIGLEAYNLTGLFSSGIDIMLDKNGDCFVLEANAGPSLTSPYRQECFAKGFDYMLEKGKENIPLSEKKGGYRKFIHPAVCPQAIA